MDSNAQAKAIEIAYEKLKRNSWSFDFKDIGEAAATILISMNNKLKETTND